jgi:hypothetical protein
MCAVGASPATKLSRDVSSSSSQSPKISQIQKKSDSSAPRSCRISFSDDVEVFWIPRMDVSEMYRLYYDDEELAQFRHEAWCATLGLNSTDFSILEKEVDDDLEPPSVHGSGPHDVIGVDDDVVSVGELPLAEQVSFDEESCNESIEETGSKEEESSRNSYCSQEELSHVDASCNDVSADVNMPRHTAEVKSRVRAQVETPRLTNAEEETTAKEAGPKAKLLDGKSRAQAHAAAAGNLANNAALVKALQQCPPPTATDVCIDVQDHPGTLAFLQIVKTSLDQIGDVDYSPPVYKLIKKQLKGRRMLICVNATKKPSYWREAAQPERIDYVGKCFEDERSKLLAMRMKRKRPHVSEPPKKKYKPHGCDGV